MKAQLCPSMMCADILSLRETLEIFEREAIEYLHIDVMDGHFVPNLMLGTDYIKRLRKASRIPLDIHLMICLLYTSTAKGAGSPCWPRTEACFLKAARIRRAWKTNCRARRYRRR